MKLTQEMINGIFEDANEQADYTLAIYKIAFPDWDDIKAISGYPKISQETNKYIFDQAISFDKKNHPDVISGGLWMNRGFSSCDETVPDWTIDISTCQCEYEGSEVLK